MRQIQEKTLSHNLLTMGLSSDVSMQNCAHGKF